MTDVINSKNRKRRVGNKVILPIFTQIPTFFPSMICSWTTFLQEEPRFSNII
jgi:hypothetical protein